MSLGLQRCIETRVHAARIALEYLMALRVRQVWSRINVALCVIKVVPCLGVDPAHGPDHLAGEQDVLDGNDIRQQVDARLMIDASIEEDILSRCSRSNGFLSACASPR